MGLDDEYCFLDPSPSLILKAIGAQSVDNRSKSLTGKDKFKLMIEMYESFRKDGKLPATYEVIYGHAWRRANTSFKAQKIELKNS